MTKKNLIAEGNNLNGMIASTPAGDRKAANSTFYRQWQVGPYGVGVLLVDSRNYSIAGLSTDITSGARLALSNLEGSVYYPLGSLQSGKKYTITWYAACDHGTTPVVSPEHYTVRVGVTFNAPFNSRSGGIEDPYTVTAGGWARMSFTFSPTADDLFYLSFKGGDGGVHTGAVISNVAVYEEEEVPELIDCQPTPDPLVLKDDGQGQLTNMDVDGWIFSFTRNGQPETHYSTATFTATGLHFTGENAARFVTGISKGIARLAPHRVYAGQDFSTGRLTITLDAGHVFSFPVTAAPSDTYTLTLEPSPLKLQESDAVTLKVAYQKNNQPVDRAMLTVEARPAALFSHLPKTLEVSAGTGQMTVTAGLSPQSGTLTVSDPLTSVSQQVMVTVSDKPHNTFTLSLLAPTDGKVVTRQETPVRIQYRDKNQGTPQGIRVGVTSLNGAQVTPATALTRPGSDGQVYAEFGVVAQQDGDVRLKFSAPEAADLPVSLLAEADSPIKRLIAMPASLVLPVMAKTSLTQPITVTDSAGLLDTVSYHIVPTSGLYVMDGETARVNGELNLKGDQARISMLKTDEQVDDYTLTFSAPGYQSGSVLVRVTNGSTLRFYPDKSRNNPEAPQRLVTHWSGMPQDFYIKVLDEDNQPVRGAKYRFTIVSARSGDAWFTTNGAHLSEVCESSKNGLIFVPSITVGDATGNFMVSLIGETSNTVLGTWYFTIITPAAIRFIKFRLTLDTIGLKANSQYSSTNTVLAFDDTDGMENAVSGQIQFVIEDKESTGTAFLEPDANSSGLKKTVEVDIYGRADIPALQTGSGGKFSITATALSLTVPAITQHFEIQ